MHVPPNEAYQNYRNANESNILHTLFHTGRSSVLKNRNAWNYFWTEQVECFTSSNGHQCVTVTRDVG